MRDPHYYQDAYYEQLLAEIESQVGPPRGRAVDFGCGRGRLAVELARSGWEVLAIDRDPPGELLQPGCSGLSVWEGSIEQWSQENRARRFELVLCNYVLEHQDEPLGLLRVIAAHLSPGGRARVAVPNDSSRLQHLAVARGWAPPEYWVVPEHRSYFSRATLARSCRAAGLVPYLSLGRTAPELLAVLATPSGPGLWSSEVRAGVDRLEALVAEGGTMAMLMWHSALAELGLSDDVVLWCRVDENG